MNNLYKEGIDYLPQDNVDDELDFQHYLRVVWHAKWSILGLIAAITVLVWVVVSSLTPVYRATAKLLIEDKQVNVVSIEEVYGIDPSQRSYFLTQLEILKSRQLAERIVGDMKLVENPAFQPPVGKQGWRKWVPFTPEPPPPTDAARWSYAVVKFQRHLTISSIPNTQLVNISFESTDPDVAYEVANKVGEAYIESDLEARLALTSDAAQWLTDRLDGMRQDLEKAETELQAYRERENLIDVGGVQTLTASEIEALNQRLLEARKLVAELRNQYDALGDVGTYNERWERLPAVLNDPLAAQLKAKETEERQKLTEISKRYGPKHPRRITAESNLNEAVSAFRNQVRNVVAGFEEAYVKAVSDQREIQRLLDQSKSEIQSISRKQYELSQLEREVQTNRQLYDLFFTRFKETNVSNQFGAAIARFVDRAIRPGKPVWPDQQIALILSVLLSGIAGAGLALLRDHLDKTIRSPSDVEEKLQQPLVGTLPFIVKDKGDTTPLSEAYFMSSKHGFAEAMRTVRTGVVLSAIDNPNSVLLVTSTLPGEGKTTVSMNLSFALGQMEKVLLIDADMRRPSVAENLGLPHRSPGLSSVIAGTHTLKEAINTHRGIDVITAGVVPPNPLELLSSSRFKDLINKLKEHYTRIVIDSAPTQAVSDSMVLSQQVDGVLYVVKADDTGSPIVKAGVQRLARVNAHMIGVVLNQFNPERANRYSKYGYEYGYYGDGYHSYASDDDDAGTVKQPA